MPPAKICGLPLCVTTVVGVCPTGSFLPIAKSDSTKAITARSLANALSLNGGTIKGQSNSQDATLTLPTPGNVGSPGPMGPQGPAGVGVSFQSQIVTASGRSGKYGVKAALRS